MEYEDAKHPPFIRQFQHDFSAREMHGFLECKMQTYISYAETLKKKSVGDENPDHVFLEALSYSDSIVVMTHMKLEKSIQDFDELNLTLMPCSIHVVPLHRHHMYPSPPKKKMFLACAMRMSLHNSNWIGID